MSVRIGRETHVTKPYLEAECQDCDWSAFRANAQGLAAQHHDRTGHSVRVEITRAVWYGPIR